MAEQGVENYDSVVELLAGMFGGVLNRDVIVTIVDSFAGDLNLSVDAVMKITNESSTPLENKYSITPDKEQSISHEKQITPERLVSNNNPNTTEIVTPVSSSITMHCVQPAIPRPSQNQLQYSNVAATPNYGVFPKVRETVSNPNFVTWNDQTRRIIEYHTRGSRTLIFMRGASGSGKTYLAQRIVELVIGGTKTDFETHIYSTDDFFIFGGKYHYNREKLSDAHAWNHDRANLAMFQGLSPLIIDNTNIQLWEMEFYARQGVLNGYILEVVEPKTPWAKKANQLARRNQHYVPIHSIKIMLENYIGNVTGDYLLKCFKLTYPIDRTPPVLRSIPVFQAPLVQTNPDGCIRQVTLNDDCIKKSELGNSEQAHSSSVTKVVEDTTPQNQIASTDLSSTAVASGSATAVASGSAINNVVDNAQSEREPEILPAPEIETVEEYKLNIDKYLEVQKQLEEIEKVEQEWENGDYWEDGQESANNSSNKRIADASPKPQRTNNETYTISEGKLRSIVNDRDWREAGLFLPLWNEETVQFADPKQPVIERISSSTCMELGDFDCNKTTYKILSTSSRNINQYHISFQREKIPDIRCLDKSTMTNEQVLTEASPRCKNEEKHFIAFRKFFPNVSKSALRDIFDTCMGDVNWAVEIVLDGMAAKQFDAVDEEEEIEEEVDNDELCNCLSSYNVVPDRSPEMKPISEQENVLVPKSETIVVAQKKTNKREIKLSDASMQLKRQIEKNVIIGDGHYSDHCLKLRKWRRGENLTDEVQNNQPSTSEDPQSGLEVACGSISESNIDDENSDDEITFEEPPEKTVNIYVGKEFIAHLDALFGRSDLSYPDTLVPKISIPISMLNQINALWMESLMHQLDEHERQTAKMMQEDEEFARVLASKEAELAGTKKPPEVLDLKEIMDLELALSLYRRDVAEWKNKEPNDLAAKLSREKLYNLFPDVAQDVLAELLMAHDNNFQTTVEVLLVSTGKTHILEEENGMNKFVMQKEFERQSKILEAEKKALSEVEWPLLPKGEVTDMAVVNGYRSDADRHLQYRNININKASDYVRRGMIDVGSYYRQLAEFHKLKYEQSNSLAAASLMQLHASKCPDSATIDLHYLRVGEALESLDLFIDTHIQKLKSSRDGQGPKRHTLFFITGRGLHSNGRPRIKPAVIKRLSQRGLIHGQVNPGLLSTVVCADNWLTHELA